LAIVINELNKSLTANTPAGGKRLTPSALGVHCNRTFDDYYKLTRYRAFRQKKYAVTQMAVLSQATTHVIFFTN
jgi:hypothetical protein